MKFAVSFNNKKRTFKNEKSALSAFWKQAFDLKHGEKVIYFRGKKPRMMIEERG